MKKWVSTTYDTETKQFTKLYIDHRKWRSLKRKHKGLDLLEPLLKHSKEIKK